MQETKMSFAEHAELPEENNLPYIECNVRYGDLEQPRCTQKAYQQFDPNIGVSMNYGHVGR